jgi:hypothetical protein
MIGVKGKHLKPEFDIRFQSEFPEIAGYKACFERNSSAVTSKYNAVGCYFRE